MRGLNNKDKRMTIRNFIYSEKSDIVCFQETKLSEMNDLILKQLLGGNARSWYTLKQEVQQEDC
jgi:exonuclease III